MGVRNDSKRKLGKKIIYGNRGSAPQIGAHIYGAEYTGKNAVLKYNFFYVNALYI